MLRRSLTLSLSLFALILLGMVSTQVLEGQRAEAQSNQAPVIQPIGDKTIKEGDALVIPFTAAGATPNVSDPENDRIDYFVERIVNGSPQALPPWITFTTDAQTAEGKVILWPGLRDAGTYQLRFRAVDERGVAATPQTVTVTVQDRTVTPAITEMKFGFSMQAAGSFFIPGSTFALPEGGAFLVEVAVADPENEPTTLRVSGLLPKATLTRRSDRTYSLEFPTTAFPPGAHADVGVYPGILTVTDASGNESSVSFTIDVRQIWSNRNEKVMMRPVPTQGLVRSIELEAGWLASIVRGDVTFSPQSMIPYLQRTIPVPAELRYRTVLHRPDADGNDVKTSLSNVLAGSQTITWSSASVPDGAYAVDIEFVDGGSAPESSLSRFGHRPLIMVVDNDPGAVSGPLWLPVAGFAGPRNNWFEPPAIEWVRWSGQPQHPRSDPYPSISVPPPQTDAERQALAARNEWFAETWMHSRSGRYEYTPVFSRTAEGHMLVDPLLFIPYPPFTFRYPFTDGGRNDAGILPEVALRPNPEGQGFWGIGPDGRFFEVTVEGVRTLAGWVTRRDIAPYVHLDSAVTREMILQNQKMLVGTFDVPFERPEDFAPDPLNTKKIYVADTDHHRIALIDRSGPIPVITTFAGITGTTGYQNGDRSQARFNFPVSVEIVGRTLYIADLKNKAIRAIDLDTGQVRTIAGNPSTPVAPVGPGSRLPLGDATLNYAWLRQDSRGNLLVMEGGDRYGFSDGKVLRVNFGQGVVEYIAKTIRGHRFDVDRQGFLGPVDHIISSGTDQTDHGVFRLDPVTGTFSLLVSDIGYPEVMSPASGGSYPVSTVIDDETSRFAHTGLYQEDLIILRPKLASDPPSPDLNLGYRGFHRYLWGTNPALLGPALADDADDEFNETRPLEDRPSFRAINGQYGYHRYGSVPLFDDLAKKSDAELAAYIRGGMAGKIAKPELTGPDLQAMMYFIRVSSLQGKRERIDPEVIKRNLQVAGYWDNPSDIRQAEIRSVQTYTADTSARIVSQTDEAAICLVQYGPTNYYGLSSSMENSYQKDHDLTIGTRLPKARIDTHHFSLICKDQAGNITRTADRLMTGAEAPPPPRVNRAPSVNAGADQTIVLPASANLNGTVSDDGLPDPPKRVTTTWNKVGGPGTVTFGDATKEDTTARFSTDGTYVLRLTANDSALSASDDIQIVVQKEGTVLNRAPTVSAGADQTITFPSTANLNGTVSDDNLPDPPKRVTVSWSKVSGPGTVTFENANAEDTTATFSEEGTYQLRLTGSDSALSSTDDVQVIVEPQAGGGLIGRWSFDEGNGTVAQDGSGRGNDGTLRNGPAWTVGKLGGALRFDGTDDFIEIPQSSALKPTRAVTFSVWVKPDVPPTNSQDVVLGWDGGSAAAYGLNFKNAGEGSLRGPRAFVYDGTLQMETFFPTPIVENRFYFIAGVFDGADGTLTLYTDGSKRQERTGLASTLTYAPFGSQRLWIGGYGGRDYYGGTFDDVCIFDKALTGEEIGKLWNDGNGMECDQLNPPSSSEELCVAPRPENRIRLGAGDYSGLATTLTITDPQGIVIYSGIHTSTTKEGEIRITDPVTLAKITDTTLYTMTAHPESHRRRKMTLLGSAMKQASCDPFPSSPFGFLDESGPVTIQHLVRLIQHYRTQADAQVNRAFLNQKFLLRDLISVIKLYVSNVRHE